MAVPETLAGLRGLVRERLFLSANDPMFPDLVVNRHINLAYSSVTGWPIADGWWWQHIEQDLQNGATDAATFGVHLTTPDNTRLIRKVFNVFGSLDGSYWLPIPQRERTDQVRLAGGQRASNGLPASWSAIPLPQTIGGVKSNIALVFDPPLPPNAFVRFICTAQNADLTADGSQLVGVPPLLTDLVVENAVLRCLKQRRAVGSLTSRRRYATELSITTKTVQEWEKAARVYFNSPAAGPGQATIMAGMP